MRRLGLEVPLFVAPMVGLSHVAFRELIRHYSPPSVQPLIFTEMLNSRRVPHEKIGSCPEVTFAADEKLFVPQLLGNEGAFLAASVKRLDEVNPWGYDLNMGCPAAHTQRHGWGLKLSENPVEAASVVAALRQATSRPLSVKIRLGSGVEVEGGASSLRVLSSALFDAGADWLTIHAREARQRHKGIPVWEPVINLREKVEQPIVGNGDLQTAADIVCCLSEWNLDGAMVGRAAVARPWIFWQLAESLGNYETPLAFSGRRAPLVGVDEGREFAQATLLLVTLLEKYFPEPITVIERVIFFVLNALPWYAFGHAFWKDCTGCRTIAELRGVISAFIGRYENPSSERIRFL